MAKFDRVMTWNCSNGPIPPSLCATLRFKFDDGMSFYVTALNNGIMRIMFVDATIEAVAKRVISLFEEGSNFKELKAIEFEFNSGVVLVTAENASIEKILQLWRKSVAEEKEREERACLETY